MDTELKRLYTLVLKYHLEPTYYYNGSNTTFIRLSSPTASEHIKEATKKVYWRIATSSVMVRLRTK